jgi:hypothetical protein
LVEGISLVDVTEEFSVEEHYAVEAAVRRMLDGGIGVVHKGLIIW